MLQSDTNEVFGDSQLDMFSSTIAPDSWISFLPKGSFPCQVSCGTSIWLRSLEKNPVVLDSL